MLPPEQPLVPRHILQREFLSIYSALQTEKSVLHVVDGCVLRGDFRCKVTVLFFKFPQPVFTSLAHKYLSFLSFFLIFLLDIPRNAWYN